MLCCGSAHPATRARMRLTSVASVACSTRPHALQAMLPEMGGHIASGGALNRSRLLQLLVFLMRDEEAAYKRRAVRGSGQRC